MSLEQISNPQTREMVNISTVFQESFMHVLGNYSPAEQTTLLQLTLSILMNERPYTLLSEGGIKHSVDLVFKNDLNRDFVLRLSFTFFARWGGTDTEYMRLCEILAFAVSQDGFGERRDRDMVAVPRPIMDMLAPAVEAAKYLVANRWATIPLLIQLFISIPESAAKPKETGTTTVATQRLPRNNRSTG